MLWLFEQVREWRERKLEVMRLESELVERERRNYLRELEEHEREEKERRQQQKQQVRAHVSSRKTAEERTIYDSSFNLASRSPIFINEKRRHSDGKTQRIE